MKVERSIMIDAPMVNVYNQVNDLRNWENWSPWLKMDPLMEMSYSNPPMGKGAYYHWESEHKYLGKGKMTIADAILNKKIVTVMEFGSGDEGSAYFTFAEKKGDIEVTWTMEEELGNNPFTKYGALFMKGAMKKQFSEGLRGLKSTCEGK